MIHPSLIPPDIHCARDYEHHAQAVLEAGVFAHMHSGASDGRAAASNLAAFADRRFPPRILRDLTGGSTVCRVAGEDRPHPIWLAPVAFQALFHPGGELEIAQAAEATDTCLVASTLSSATLEDIAAIAGPDRWFQLYVQPSREATADLVRRAEAAGYTAIVLTVDVPVQRPGLATQRAGFRGTEHAANLARYPQAAPEPVASGSRIFQGPVRHAPTWADIAWLRSRTSLPVWIKGVMHPDDARAAFEAGAAGVIVSNHGGRALTLAPPSLLALPAVRAAVGPHAPVLFDGGVRSGEDVFTAIASGADGVMIGRLQASALAVAGALGVAHMIRLLREELEITMALAGCASLTEVARAEQAPK